MSSRRDNKRNGSVSLSGRIRSDSAVGVEFNGDRYSVSPVAVEQHGEDHLPQVRSLLMVSTFSTSTAGAVAK
jgi:hypothetical protein